MGVGNDAGVMEVVIAGDVRKQTVKDEDVALLRLDRGEILAATNVIADMIRGQGWVEPFRMIIQMLDNT